MTDNSTDTAATATEPNPPPANYSTTEPAPARSGKGVAWTALLLSLAAGGGGAYLWQQFEHNKQSQETRVRQQLEQIVQQREADITGLQNQLSEQRNAAQTLLSQTQTLTGQNEAQQREDQNLRQSINSLQSEIKSLQGNIATLKGEVEIHKGGVEIQKADTQNLISHVRNIQTDIKNLQDQSQAVNAAVESQKSDNQTHKSSIQALQQDIQNLTGNLQGVKDRLESSLAERAKLVGDLDNRIQNLQLAQRNLLTTLDNVRTVVARGGDVNALPLSEVEYLMRLADYKLRLQSNVPSAITALTEAEQRLGAINEEAFNGVRQMIRDNIAALRAVDVPDRAALAQKILDMEGRLQNLPLRTEAQIAALKEKTKPHELAALDGQSERPWWERTGNLFKEQFKDLIAIRRTRSDEPPLLARQEEYFLFQNLRLELEAMRIALLSNDANHYMQSDAQAQQWIKTYFNLDAPDVQSFLAELESLRAMKLNPYLPDIGATLRAFQDIMRTRTPVRSVATPAQPQ